MSSRLTAPVFAKISGILGTQTDFSDGRLVTPNRKLVPDGILNIFVQFKPMPTSEEIREAIEQQLETQLHAVPGPQDDWIRAGMDSLEVIDVLLKLETKFEQEIPVGEFASEPTTDSLVEFLAQHLGEGSP